MNVYLLEFTVGSFIVTGWHIYEIDMSNGLTFQNMNFFRTLWIRHINRLSWYVCSFRCSTKNVSEQCGWTFLERAPKSGFSSDLYQIFSFKILEPSDQIRYSNIAENSVLSDLIWSDQNLATNVVWCPTLNLEQVKSETCLSFPLFSPSKLAGRTWLSLFLCRPWICC